MRQPREKRAPRDPIADQLRRAVRASGRSVSHLAKDAGLDRRGLGRFVGSPERTCSVETAEAVAEALGLTLVLAGAKKGPGKPRPAA